MNIKRLFIISGSILLGLTLVPVWFWLFSGPPIFTRAASYTVCPTGPPTCDYSTVQAAVDASSSGDTIIVASGIYTENVTIVGLSLTIEGSHTVGTIVDGNESGSVFTINSGAAVTITDMTVTNGTGTWSNGYTYGGGFYVTNSSLTVRNCTVADNTASDGAGGLEAYDSTIGVFNCNFSDNNGWWGGSITLHGGDAEIVNNIIDESSCGYGGAIFITDSSQASFINNLIMNTYCSMGQTAGIGIGESSSAVITNNTIVNNMHHGIATNTDGVGGEGSAIIKNNILWGNNDDLVNLTATYSNIEDGDLGEGNIGANPMFVDPTNNDYHLQITSPCIDTGNNDGAPDVDFELDPRPVDGNADGIATVDMGADEIPQRFNHDIETQLILAPVSDETVYGPISPILRIRNIGTNNEGGFSIVGEITLGNTQVYSDTKIVTGLAILEATDVTFTEWVPQTAGNHEITFRTQLESDENPDNDTLTGTLYVGGHVCNFKKYSDNPVFSTGPGGSWDDDDVVDPTVLKDGSTYMMWYTGYDGTGPSKIGLATSADGLSWTKHASNPVLTPGGGWEVNGVRAASVIFDEGHYKMWYSGYDSNWISSIGLATSDDGITWSKYGSNPVLVIGPAESWESEDVYDPTVLKEGFTYHMWYTGYDGMTLRIGHATSSNGVDWTRDTANPVLDVGQVGNWDWLGVYTPNAVKIGNRYELWYSGETLPPSWQIGYAFSLNGTDWSRGGLLIREGSPDKFDAYSADYPSVIVEGNKYKVWYSGLGQGGTYKIGFGTARACAVTTGLYQVYLPISLNKLGCSTQYTDKFSDPGSGWPDWEDDEVKYAYTGNEYQLWVKKPEQGWYATPGAKAQNFTVAVSARRTKGDWGAYGIQFGINEDWSEFYEFNVDGSFFSVWKYEHGNWSSVMNWAHSDYITTGTGWNRLKVIRDGHQIIVYANDHLLGWYSDMRFLGMRRIGLAAYSPTDSGLDARFDDFSLYPVSCGADATRSILEMGAPEIHTLPLKPEKLRSPGERE